MNLKNILQKATTPVKSKNEIIEEIHESFFTEVDKLLAVARISKSTETKHQELIDKRNRLVALGFTNSIEVKEAEVELARLSSIEKENQENTEMIKAIDYFSFKYPNYKFITKESVEKICKKYGLIYSTIDKFKGIVPNENLKKIEEFKIDDEDKVYFYRISFLNRIVQISFEQYKKYLEYNEEIRNTPRSHNLIYKLGTLSLEIAATPSEFDTAGMKLSGVHLKIIYKDPIVLQPVMYNDKNYFLVVTAWGKEASDGLVVNERNN